MKYLIFPDENPVPILDKSYVTNIQMECQTITEALMLTEIYANKDWSHFSISRGENVTEYEEYVLTSIVIDLSSSIIIHFILDKSVNIDEYVEAAKIFLGETI